MLTQESPSRGGARFDYSVGATHIGMAKQVSVIISLGPYIQFLNKCVAFFVAGNISRRDEALLALKNHQSQAGEELKEFTTSVIEYNTKVSFLHTYTVDIASCISLSIPFFFALETR